MPSGSGRGPECRTRAERFWRPLWSLDRPLRGPGGGLRTRDLFLGKEACCWLHHARAESIFLERPAGLAPACQAWKARALLLSYGRTLTERRWTPPCSPRAGSTSCSLNSGPIVKGLVPQNFLKQDDPALRPIPGNPDGDRTRSFPPGRTSAPAGKQKNPALVSEGGVWINLRGQVNSSSCIPPHLGPHFPGLAVEKPGHGSRIPQVQAWGSENGPRASPGQMSGSSASLRGSGRSHGNQPPSGLSFLNPPSLTRFS